MTVGLAYHLGYFDITKGPMSTTNGILIFRDPKSPTGEFQARTELKHIVVVTPIIMTRAVDEYTVETTRDSIVSISVQLKNTSNRTLGFCYVLQAISDEGINGDVIFEPHNKDSSIAWTYIAPDEERALTHVITIIEYGATVKFSIAIAYEGDMFKIIPEQEIYLKVVEAS
jgi:hypothetical protein